VTLAALRSRLSSDPANHELAAELGDVYLRRGETPVAREYLQSAAHRASGSVAASYYCRLANTTCEDDPLLAAEYCRAALDADPSCLDAYLALSSVYQRRIGSDDLALHWLTQALPRVGPHCDVLAEIAAILLHNAVLDDAERAFASIVGPLPDPRVEVVALARALGELGRYDEALSLWQRLAIEHGTAAPANVHLGLARSYERLGEPADALQWYERGLTSTPQNGPLLRNYLMHLLRRGRYDEARRVHIDWCCRVHPDRPRWWEEGGAVNRTFRLVATPGYGDMIQFVRFARALAGAGARRVVVECPRQLIDLFAFVDGVDRCLLPGDEEADADVREDLSGLFLKLSTPRTLGMTQPYLRVPHIDAAAWRPRVCLGPGLDRRGSLRVGLVWSSSEWSRDSYTCRNVPLPALAPLFELEDVTWYALQRGPDVRQLATTSAARDVIDVSRHLRTFADTAAAVANLDLVVTVDTSVTHVAGALCRPTVVLLPYHTDWRWCFDTTRTPWYPTVHLFRQPAPGVWNPVVDAVRTLVTRMKAKRHTLATSVPLESSRAPA
jgi:Tfp pilus assembly protein PilF